MKKIVDLFIIYEDKCLVMCY